MSNFIVNPFQFEGIVTGQDFCKRDDDVNNLLEYMHSSNNVIISMKRRVGKTSLIKEMFENHIKDKKLIAGYVDIYGITSVKELYIALKEEVESLLNLSSTIGIEAQRVKDAFSEANISLTLSSSPKFSVEFSGNSYEVLIKKLFVSLQEYAVKNNLKFVFAIDEFQKITSLNEKDMEKIETNIRTAMQACRNISFIISGSNQTMLDSMFKERRPLYRQGVHYTLNPIDAKDFYKWATEKFKRKEITIEKDAFAYIYKLANTEAKIVQQICFELFRQTKQLENIKVEDVCEIVKKIYKNNSEIASKFNNLKLNEQKMLKVVALETEYGITVSPLLSEYDINHGSVSNTLKKMVEKYVLIKHDTANYEIVDTELRLWILVSKNSLCA